MYVGLQFNFYTCISFTDTRTKLNKSRVYVTGAEAERERCACMYTSWVMTGNIGKERKGSLNCLVSNPQSFPHCPTVYTQLAGNDNPKYVKRKGASKF